MVTWALDWGNWRPFVNSSCWVLAWRV